MAHSWESPANAAREQLLKILESHLPERALRATVIDLVLEEVDRQFADPDDEMIVTGELVLAAAGGAEQSSTFNRRLVVENIWRAMAEKAFGR